MPKKGQRQDRRCKCGKPVLEKITNGKLKGYLRTCRDHFKQHHKRGPQHHNAKKRGRRVKEGYVYLLIPTGEKNGGLTGSRYTPEHRLVMSQKLGRPLLRTEQVHHINGIRDDNRPENLALIGPGEKHESRTLIKALYLRIQELEAQLTARG